MLERRLEGDLAEVAAALQAWVEWKRNNPTDAVAVETLHRAGASPEADPGGFAPPPPDWDAERQESQRQQALEAEREREALKAHSAGRDGRGRVMGTDPENPFGLGTFERAFVGGGRPTARAGLRHVAALLGAVKGKAADAARKEAEQIEAAGRAEDAATRERYLRWELDQLDDDSAVTDGLIATAAAVEADQQAEREAWRAKQARLKQLGELGM